MILSYLCDVPSVGFHEVYQCILTPDQQARCQEMQHRIDELLRNTLPESTTLVENASSIRFHHQLFDSAFSFNADYSYKLNHDDAFCTSHIVYCSPQLSFLMHSYYLGEIDKFPSLSYFMDQDNMFCIIISPSEPNFNFFEEYCRNTATLLPLNQLLYAPSMYAN